MLSFSKNRYTPYTMIPLTTTSLSRPTSTRPFWAVDRDHLLTVNWEVEGVLRRFPSFGRMSLSRDLNTSFDSDTT